MRRLLLYGLLLLSLRGYASDPELQTCRKMMIAAYTKADAARYFYQHTRLIPQTAAPILLGFKAMSSFMLCRYVNNPMNKLSYFNKGKTLLEYAIEKDPGNAELRFMRLSVQDNTPAMLQYKDHLEEDYHFLSRYLNSQAGDAARDEALEQNIRRYFNEHNLKERFQ